MKITVTLLASDDLTTAAGLLNITGKRRRKFKKDNSPEAIKARRKAAQYRRTHKAQLKKSRDLYMKRNKTRIAQRRKFLQNAPKGPVLQRAQAAGDAEWKKDWKKFTAAVKAAAKQAKGKFLKENSIRLKIFLKDKKGREFNISFSPRLISGQGLEFLPVAGAEHPGNKELLEQRGALPKVNEMQYLPVGYFTAKDRLYSELVLPLVNEVSDLEDFGFKTKKQLSEMLKGRPLKRVGGKPARK